MSVEPSHATVEQDGRLLAEATLRPGADQNTVHADLHVEEGHLPVGTRARLVDAVLDEPAAEPGTRLEAPLPAGDGEMLDRLRQRCDDVDSRSAGASILASGDVPRR